MNYTGDIRYDTLSDSIKVYDGTNWTTFTTRYDMEEAEQRFIVVNKFNSIVISDYKYYVRNQVEIDEWCSENLSYYDRQGVIMSLGSAEDMTLFVLRWCSDV